MMLFIIKLIKFAGVIDEYIDELTDFRKQNI